MTLDYRQEELVSKLLPNWVSINIGFSHFVSDSQWFSELEVPQIFIVWPTSVDICHFHVSEELIIHIRFPTNEVSVIEEESFENFYDKYEVDTFVDSQFIGKTPVAMLTGDYQLEMENGDIYKGRV